MKLCNHSGYNRRLSISDCKKSAMNNITDDFFLNSDTPSDIVLKRAIRLNKTIIKSGIRQGDIADKIGVSRQTLNKLVKGRQKITYDWACRLAEVLKTTPDFLMGKSDLGIDAVNIEKNGIAIQTLSVPAGAGGGKIIDEYSIWSESSYFDASLIIERLRTSPENLYSMTIEGQSMEPILENGDTILINKNKTDVSEPGIFVLFDGDGIVCKWVERIVNSNPAQYRILSENPRFSAYTVLAEQTQIIGRVVWYGRIL